LRQNGVFVTDFQALGIADGSDARVMAEGTQLADVLVKRANAMGNRRPDVMSSTPEDLLEYREIYRWGLHPVLLRIVEAYQRRPVAYDGPLVFHARADGRETATRRWHLDREDRRVIKVAIYLHDVGDDGGPFQVLNYAARKPGEPFRYRLFDTAGLKKTFGANTVDQNIKTCPGKSGTVIIAETGRFYHRGKPATSRERSTIFFSYFSRSPRHPFFCSRSRLSRSQIVELVSGLDPAQRAAALWQDELPLIARMIPPSRL
jgi:hypothetical protein